MNNVSVLPKDKNEDKRFRERIHGKAPRLMSMTKISCHMRTVCRNLRNGINEFQSRV